MPHRQYLKYSNDEKCVHKIRLDPYNKGCSGGCKYCYAKALVDGWWNNWHEEPSAGMMKKIRYRLRHDIKDGDVVRIGSMADPLQPIEEEKHITEMTVEECVRLGIHHVIITKFARVVSEDMLSVYDKRFSHFQITLTATDDDFVRRYEEGASSVSERISAIEKLQSLGYDVSIRLSPFVVDFVDSGMLDLSVVNAMRCDKILVEFLRVSGQIRKSFGSHIDMRRYTEISSRYHHLPLEVKRDYVERLLLGSPKHRQISITDVVPEHHSYWVKHYNANKSDCCNLRL